MGTETIPAATPGTAIPSGDHNSLKGALQGEFTPRNSSGAPTTGAGTLGSTTYRWLSGYVTNLYALTKSILGKAYIGEESDNNTIETSSGDIVIKRNGVEKLKIETTGVNATYLKDASLTTAKIIDGNVTQAKIYKKIANSSTASAGDVAILYVSTSTTSATVVTLATITLTTTGRPVRIGLIPSSINGTGCELGVLIAGTAQFYFYRDAVLAGRKAIGIGTESIKCDLLFLDVPAAGTYSYTIQASVSGGGTAVINQYSFIAYEL